MILSFCHSERSEESLSKNYYLIYNFDYYKSVISTQAGILMQFTNRAKRYDSQSSWE